MGRCLIVANQTLGGPALESEVRERIERGEGPFYVLVPMTAPKHESTTWLDGFALPQGLTSSQAADACEVILEMERRRQVAVKEARERAEHRLDLMVEQIRSLGGDAEGEVGDADPAVAVGELLQHRSFDEILVSTLPRRISRWLKMDVPSLVERLTDVPVTIIEAE